MVNENGRWDTMLKKLRLSTRITLIIAICMIIGFGSVSVVSYAYASHMMTEATVTELSNSAQNAATLIKTRYDAIQMEAKMAAQLDDIRSMNWQRQKAALDRLVEQLGCSEAGVADLSGTLRTNNGSTADISDREYFKKALEGKTSVTDPTPSRVNAAEIIILVAAPIYNDSGRVSGVLVLPHPADNLTQMASDITAGKTGYGYIINQQGVVVAHPDTSLVSSQHSFIEASQRDRSLTRLAEINRKMIRGESGFGEYEYQGVEKVTAYAPIPGTAWSIGLAVPRSEFYSHLRELLIVIAVITVVVIVGTILTLTQFMQKNLINRLLNLRDISEKVAQGDVNVDIDGTMYDIIGEVSLAFKKVIENAKLQAQSVQKIASGDLTVSVPVRSEADLLGNQLNALIDAQNEVLSSIALAADHVAAGADQLSTTSSSLAQGATEQAGAIEELTSTIDEIAGKTEHNADNAVKARELSGRAKDYAAESNRRMQEMLRAMEDINTSSDNISKIIKVIDDIAFQTNILALNAAVEAARAGQYGRGFAVVAEEVRNLAARSASAAKETTSLIDDSMRKVDAGMKIADETADSLGKIVGAVDEAAALVAEIADASREQANSIAQIKDTLSQINAVVQTNSASAEESAASSEQLAAQASLMKEQIRRFILRSQTASSRAPSQPGKKRALAPARENIRISLGEGDKY